MTQPHPSAPAQPKLRALGSDVMQALQQGRYLDPHHLKLRNGETKWILKRALRGVIPDAIIDRPKKGFGMPVGRWLREGRFDFDLEKTPAALDRDFISKKLAAHRAGKADERLFLWSEWVLAE